MSPTFTSLHNRNYRLFFTGGLVSNTGTWMQRVAQDWLVLQVLHGTGTQLGITTGLQFLPMLLFSMWAGVLADRYSKRALLYVTQTGLALTALALGLLDVAGVAQIWHVYVLAFLTGVITALDNPTRQSFVVEMVGREHLSNAVGLNSASFQSARVIGPAAAGLLINWIGTGPVFLVNAASFIAVLISLTAMNPALLHPAPRTARGPGQLREGLRYVRARPDLLFVLLVVFFVGTFGMNFQMTTALMAVNVFHRGAGQYGLLGSAMAVGSVVGALFAARRKRPRLRLIVLATAAFGIAEVAAGVMPTYLTFALSLPFAGVTALTVITAANSTMQLAVSPVMRGRVMALYMAVFMGGTPLGAPIVGWVGQTFGPRWTLWLGGVLSAVPTLLGAVVIARRNPLVVRPHLRPRPKLEIVAQELADTVQQA